MCLATCAELCQLGGGGAGRVMGTGKQVRCSLENVAAASIPRNFRDLQAYEDWYTQWSHLLH
jgi:hypothetical protein